MSKKKYYVYVMNYEAGTIVAFETTTIDNIEDQLCERKYRESQCSWMVVEEQQEVEWLDE